MTSPGTGAFTVRRLAFADVATGAALCASGMRDSPLHRRIHGSRAATRLGALRCFFHHLLCYQVRHGMVFGAWRGARLMGVFGLMPPGVCRPGPWQAVRLLPALGCSCSLVRLARTLRWLIAWRRHDPAFPHWHLGPLVVAGDLQGSGVGPRLVRRVVAQLETGGIDAAWLETDQHANVRLYEKMGFRLVATATVAGVPNWFMRGVLAVPDDPRTRRRPTSAP